MLASIKTEFRKLLTVRSTYFIPAFCVVLACIFAFYAEGIRANPESLNDPFKLSSEVTGAVGAVSIILAIIGLLLLAHEYHYNTIMYTLTSSNNRSKSLLAKILVSSVAAVTLTMFFMILSPLLTKLGLAIKGYELVPQTFYFKDLLWRCLFYGWGYMMAALLLIALIRNQTAAIVALFIGQSTVEILLGLLLKGNRIYLPFSSLNSVMNPTPEISFAKSAMVFSIYLVVGWAVAFILFARRDAN